jgi:hypothetical protein
VPDQGILESEGGKIMNKVRTLILIGFSMSMGLGASAAIAGEITGNGTPIDINARSFCAYSGQNDTPQGAPPPHFDPGGNHQSYGQFVGEFDLFDPSDADPRTGGFPPIPGFSCNPNRGEDLHAGG